MFNKHAQEIMLTLLSNNAQLYKENKNIKYNMFICNRLNICTKWKKIINE